jgi:hypothetical protein
VFSDNRNLFIVYGSVPVDVFNRADNGVIKITIRGNVVALADGKVERERTKYLNKKKKKKK